MIVDRSLDMTGFWIGEYRYRWPGIPTVPFLANMEETAAALTGRIDEPNMTGRSSGRLFSFVEGRRTGLAIEFAKVYDGASDMAHRVDYRGTMAADGLSIAGSWILQDDTGPFRMTREAVEEIEQEADAEGSRDLASNLLEERR